MTFWFSGLLGWQLRLGHVDAKYSPPTSQCSLDPGWRFPADMCIDMCVDMCIDMCVDMCLGMCFNKRRGRRARLRPLCKPPIRTEHASLVQQYLRVDMCADYVYAGAHARTHARTHAHTHARARAHTHMPAWCSNTCHAQVRHDTLGPTTMPCTPQKKSTTDPRS